MTPLEFKHKNKIIFLVFCIVVMAAVASSMGIFSSGGPGPYQYESIRQKTVVIYGKGLYQHMSAEVAPQGIAQDYATLFLGIPLLLTALFMARHGSLKGRFLLAGTLTYFFVTYLFYLLMGMYNMLFPGYVLLTGSSFFALALTLLSFNTDILPQYFQPSTPAKSTGYFLIFSSIAIALLWLGIVVPPLLDGSVIPVQVEHYTTLIVQGLDLAIFLPLAFVSGILFIQKKTLGFLLAPVYFIFLSLLMTALTAKVMAMAILGYNVIPVVFIIPVFNLVSILCTVSILKNIKEFKA